MKKRYFYILLCVISLCIGGGLYIIFRPNTYVAEFARGLFHSASTIFSSLEEINCDFIKYYFPDLIWAFSLNCGLNAIFNSKKSIFINSGIVLGIGALWEISQHLSIVSGTGDFIDLAMYLCGILLIIIPEAIIMLKQKSR